MIEVALPGAEVRFTEAADGMPWFGRPMRFATQVHGAAVSTDDSTLEAADAQVTRRNDLAVGVRVADCVPVALVAADGVAMVHAGWRGLAAGVLEAAMAQLGPLTGAAIGPCAGPCCYEVGDEVRAAFGIDTATADLPELVAQRLPVQPHRTGLCTIHDERFFSYRRQGAAAGRQAGIAWRT